MKAPSLETGLFFASIRNLRHTNPRTIEGCRKSTFTAFARLRYNGCMITLAVLDYRMPARAASSPDILETPFGPVAGRRTAGTITLAAATLPDPRAAAYAARLAGAERVLAVILEPDLTQPTLPRDFIEFTDERPTTFFETVGTGYVQQQPPFCPEMTTALGAAGARQGGNLLILDNLPAPDTRAWWRNQGVAAFTTHSQPEGALCRELEMCWATLLVPPNFDLSGWPGGVNLPSPRACACGHAMQFARRAGKLPPDWRRWVIPR